MDDHAAYKAVQSADSFDHIEINKKDKMLSKNIQQLGGE
jgi:hypothetical protein